jgi:hypothetical protein
LVDCLYDANGSTTTCRCFNNMWQCTEESDTDGTDFGGFGMMGGNTNGGDTTGFGAMGSNNTNGGATTGFGAGWFPQQ